MHKSGEFIEDLTAKIARPARVYKSWTKRLRLGQLVGTQVRPLKETQHPTALVYATAAIAAPGEWN